TILRYSINFTSWRRTSSRKKLPYSVHTCHLLSQYLQRHSLEESSSCLIIYLHSPLHQPTLSSIVALVYIQLFEHWKDYVACIIVEVEEQRISAELLLQFVGGIRYKQLFLYSVQHEIISCPVRMENIRVPPIRRPSRRASLSALGSE
ncbi:hypothetical protein PMAYCL1PPCAC_26963, partial [Pristionchus mayeri]